MISRRRSPKTYEYERTKKLPLGRVKVGVKVIPKGKKKVKAYAQYEA